MKFCSHWLKLVLTCLVPTIVSAQISITSPVARMVFQRNTANQATFVISGKSSLNAESVEARLTPIASSQGTPTDWTRLDFFASSKTFQGPITATSGWYQLTVRTKSGATVVEQTTVNRVGIGEVFVIAGQSNAVGGFEREPGAADDRVSCLDFRQTDLNEQLLPLSFSHASYGASIGPSQPPHIWAALGDKLVQRLNVPVLFLGSATPGTSSDQWQQSAAGYNVLQNQPMPYRRLGVVLQHYIARTGMRAVLWHQGEGDIGSSNTTYFNNIKYVIQKTRQQAGFDQLPWVVSRVSYSQGQTNSNVIGAQNRLVNEVNDVFAGPSTDDLTGSDNRLGDNVHIGGNGLARFVDRWNQALTDDFFARSSPFTANAASGSSLITNGYTLPLKRRAGETIQVPSLRSTASETDNAYFVQLVQASDNRVVATSSQSTANPLSFTLPGDLPDGQYRLRTVSTRPAITGTLSEAFTISSSAPGTSSITAIAPSITGGTSYNGLQRFGYRYESDSHGFYMMVQSSVPVETKVERIDGGSFGDSNWQVASPSSQNPDYVDFADYNYFRFYSPAAAGVGGIEQGRYRFSVRRQGDSGSGFWYETTVQNGRNTVYQGVEPIILVPDLSPLIYIQPSILYGTSNFSVTTDVVEVNAVATSGLITVKVTKDARIKLTFDQSATTVNGRAVQNSAWWFDDSDPNYYILKTNQKIAENGKLSLGLNGVLTSGSTTGSLTISTVIEANSGGEVKVDNNTVANKINYFRN